jgi:putative transposase
MRDRAAKKLEIIRLVERSSLSVRRTLAQLGIPRATFYRWYQRYLARGAGALGDGQSAPRRGCNKLPEKVAAAVVELALQEPELSPRELATAFVDQRQYFVSEASVYRLLKARGLITSPAFILLKAADHFAQPTTAVNELSQTDFTYLRVIGWGWFYLSTVLDDFSRYIQAWKLCTTMTATDVTETLRLALNAAGLNHATVRQRPRLLSDNGPSYLSAQLDTWLDEHGMTHTRGQPYHPMTQGKIERYHRSPKNRILLEHYYLPGQLEARLAEFVDFYNTRRYHESLGNLTPADIYFGRGLTILQRRQSIKHQTIELRRRLHQQSRRLNPNPRAHSSHIFSRPLSQLF